MQTTLMDKDTLSKLLAVRMPESYFKQVAKRIEETECKLEEAERRNNDHHFLNRVYSL